MPDKFSKYMNPPEEPTYEQFELDAILKIREIVGRGNSAEIKRRADGCWTIYEVRKNKR